jgi:hypothetical protein
MVERHFFIGGAKRSEKKCAKNAGVTAPVPTGRNQRVGTFYFKEALKGMIRKF